MNPSDNIIEKKVESSLISAEVNEKYLDDQNELAFHMGPAMPPSAFLLDEPGLA